jgi:serine/threonine-protein kinase
MNAVKEPDTLPRAFGPYTLLKLLARGGMGEIYLARICGLADFEKFYVVKKLLNKFVKDADVTTRFMDEAKLGARLGHPNVVQVHDLGCIGNELYMAAEFVDGFDLRRILRFCHEKQRCIPLDISLFVVREILSGLAYAHRQLDAGGKPIELVHRDISPQNVLVSFEGEVKIIDFGLAKSTQRTQETQANVLLGNFGYMSPEQARGKKLDVRTDVYSTGVVLFELLTGTKRFVDDNPLSLLEKVANPTPLLPGDRVAGVPPALDLIYAKATMPRREDRYQSAALFRDDISHALFKINHRASRERVAEFLNFLFLGGLPPEAVERDMASLNRSMSIHLREVVAQSAAFMSTKEEDVKDRHLAYFGAQDPITDTHPPMKSARLGDKLRLAEIFRVQPPPLDATESGVAGATPAMDAALPPVPALTEPPPATATAPVPESRAPAPAEVLLETPLLTDSAVLSVEDAQPEQTPGSIPQGEAENAHPPSTVASRVIGRSKLFKGPDTIPNLPVAVVSPPPIPPPDAQSARQESPPEEALLVHAARALAAEVPIARWSVAPSGVPAPGLFPMGTTTAESLIIDVDDAAGAHEMSLPVAQEPPPGSGEAGVGAGRVRGALEDDGARPAGIRPAMQPATPFPLRTATPLAAVPDKHEESRTGRWVLKREASRPPEQPVPARGSGNKDGS